MSAKKLSKAQLFAAWKSEHRVRDIARAEAQLAKHIQEGRFKGCKQGLGRGWKKWADRKTSETI